MMQGNAFSGGLARIRQQFVSRLTERRARMLKHILDAANDADEATRHAHLAAARYVIHQIAGTAGTLGFVKLGVDARRLENMIDTNLDGEMSNDLLEVVLAFSDDCEAIVGSAG